MECTGSQMFGAAGFGSTDQCGVAGRCLLQQRGEHQGVMFGAAEFGSIVPVKCVEEQFFGRQF